VSWGSFSTLPGEEEETMRVSFSTVVVATLVIGGSVALRQEELTAAQPAVTNLVARTPDRLLIEETSDHVVINPPR
jgi:hypothetical protein